MANTGTSLACYGCVDFANNERTKAYWKWACAEGMFSTPAPMLLDLCACEADSPDNPYVDPVTDEVCWYDSAVPESAEFLGVIILNRPVQNSTFSREISDGFVQGSILNRPKLTGRPFVFDALLIATSCEGMAYGKEWLRRLLEDAPCQADSASKCQSCFGRRMSLRVTCPDEEIKDDGIHEWMSVGLVDGIANTEETSNLRNNCCTLQPISFTMHSEAPYSFSTVGDTICDVDADPESYTRCFNWLEDCFDCNCEVVNCDRCKYDPVCSCFPFIIPEPELPRDDCDSCIPLAKTIQCCCSEDLPAGYDTTFKIDIYSGVDFSNEVFQDTGMRDFKIKIYQNPKGFDCITDDETYDLWCNEVPCVELSINYIPYDSTLTIDGRTEKITLTCNGVCKPYQHKITSSTGQIFPLLSRCTPIMVCSEFSYYNTQFMPEEPGIRPAHITVDSYLRFRN